MLSLGGKYSFSAGAECELDIYKGGGTVCVSLYVYTDIGIFNVIPSADFGSDQHPITCEFG